jgi:hypothetical protein
MIETSLCPKCQHPIDSVDFYCRNCGKNINPVPLSTSASVLIILFIKTILLPPLGLFWGYKYLRQSDSLSKAVGAAIIFITLLETIWVVQSTITAYNTITTQVNQLF